jgi:hypothetical protein
MTLCVSKQIFALAYQARPAAVATHVAAVARVAVAERAAVAAGVAVVLKQSSQSNRLTISGLTPALHCACRPSSHKIMQKLFA